MLVLKKMEKKKIILYIFIMIVMLSGTIFFVIKNYTLTSARSLLILDPIEEFTKDRGNISEKDKNIEELEFIGTDKQIADLGLFAGRKFNNLKENIISIKDFVIGQENHFRP